jgi:hypothetical protein
LRLLNLSRNNITSLFPEVFEKTKKLEWLHLADNNITDIHPSTFRSNSRLRYLNLSRNNITSLDPEVFIENQELEWLDLPNRQNQQVCKRKDRNLAENKIQSFNFEPYFPLNRNSVTCTLTFELVSLNLSSNRLESLDTALVRWLKHTSAVTDLSWNPWNCDCSALGEAWRELKHKLTLDCVSPAELRGRTWDVIGTLCPEGDTHATPNITTDTGPALKTAALVVNGILLVCTTVGAGFILVQLLKKLRNRSEVPEHTEECIPLSETGSSVRVS